MEVPSPSDHPPASKPPHPRVRFDLEPRVATIKRNSSVGRNHVNMDSKHYDIFHGDKITDAMLAEAAALFSENYGVWGKGSMAPGERVKISPSRLRRDYLPDGSQNSYIKVTVDGKLAGNAFVSRWTYGNQNICWVTQLVVHGDYRERGLGGGLLGALKVDTDDIYGIMSSHPAACLAAAKSFGTIIDRVPLDFIRDHASNIMEASPITYIREAKLSGSIFNSENSMGLVSGVDTGFFVDHGEPLEALGVVRQECEWPLGDLPDGHEYLLTLRARKRRSRSRSAGRPTDVDP